MNERIAIVILGLLKPINPYTSMIMGFLTMFWGLWLLLPWRVFDTAPLFYRLSDLAPEVAWGVLALTGGAMVICSAFKGSFKWLVVSLSLVSWHWALVSVFMWWGDWQNTGGLTYSFLCIYSIYSQINIKVNYINEGIEHFHPRTSV